MLPLYLVIKNFNGSEQGKTHKNHGQDLNGTNGCILLMLTPWKHFYKQLILSFNIASETF